MSDTRQMPATLSSMAWGLVILPVMVWSAWEPGERN